MNTIIHLLNPIQKPGSSFIEMKCGKTKHIRIDKINASENPGEVTCTKCLGFINNPARTLRKYGHVKIMKPYGFSLTAAWGHHIDIMAFTTDLSGGRWRYIANIEKQTITDDFEVENFHKAIEMIITVIENKFVKPYQS